MTYLNWICYEFHYLDGQFYMCDFYIWRCQSLTLNMCCNISQPNNRNRNRKCLLEDVYSITIKTKIHPRDTHPIYITILFAHRHLRVVIVQPKMFALH